MSEIHTATLEDALLDPIAAEALRASVDGEWVDEEEETEDA